MGEGDAATHLIQVVNQPHQIVIVKVRDRLLVQFSIKDVAELIMKPG